MIVFYTSGHGFGHASRDIEVMNAVARQRPDVPIVVRSSVPAWLFKASSRSGLPEIDVQTLETDSGVAQHDSLTIDEEETAHAARRFYQGFDQRVAAEAAWLLAHRATLVVADIPPLAIAAAARADIPSVALANFTWDWIYRGFPDFEGSAPEVIEIIAAAYSRASHALRLPLHGGFAPMQSVVRDIPFVARRSTIGRDAARRALDLTGTDDARPIVLASFGGHHLPLPYAAAAAGDSMTLLLLTSAGAVPRKARAQSSFLKWITQRDLSRRRLHYEDLVAAADVVISKPGYGIVSECIANNTALLYSSRGRLIEYDVMVAEMPRLLRCRFITQDDLLAGRWADGVEALLRQPPPPLTPMTNGAAVAAEFILKIAGG